MNPQSIFRCFPLTLVALVACSEVTNGPGEPQPVVASIAVDDPSPLSSLGDVVDLAAVVLYDDGTTAPNPSIDWESLDAGVATVSSSGRVLARANGSAKIVAAISGLADTVTVVVAQQVAGVRVFPDPADIELPGDTLRAEAHATDARGNEVAGPHEVAWTASGAISVDSTGRIEASAFGTGTVTARIDGVQGAHTVSVIGDRFFLSQGVRLRYDLDLPDASGGPFPGVVFVHGSGMVTRNTQRGTTDPLVPEGMAALRYDKRGVGESGGTYLNVSVGNSVSTLGTLATDAANAVRFMARLDVIDPTRIGLLGNSQGGWIVPMAARREPNLISYIMLWSGPTVSVGLEIYYSNLAEGTSTPLESVYPQLSAFPGPDGYESLPDIAALDIPGIWLYGEMDRSIPALLDIERIAELRDAGKPFEVVVYEFGDHALRDTRVNMFYNVWAAYLKFLRDHGILD